MPTETTVKLFYQNKNNYETMFSINEMKIEETLRTRLKCVDFDTVQEVQIMFYPTCGTKDFTSKQTWFKRGSHLQICDVGNIRRELSALWPVHGLSERFEEARRCLDIMCQYLGARMKPTSSVTLDFIVYGPMDAAVIMQSLRYMRHVSQIQVGYDGSFLHPANPHENAANLPWGGRSLLRQVVAGALRKHVHAIEMASQPSTHHSPGFPFSKLPAELQSMVLSYIVTDPAEVMLQMHSNFYRLHAKRCCGQCRGFEVSADYDCRCNDGGSLSTACRCVYLSDPIFSVSKAIRAEALRQFWQQNIFLLHGPLELALSGVWARRSDFETRTTVEAQLMAIPTAHLRLIRHLIIDTDCPVQHLSVWVDLVHERCMPSPWGDILFHLEKHGGPQLEVEIRISNLSVSTMGSYGWEYAHNHDNGLRGNQDRVEYLEEERQKFVDEVGGLKLKVYAWERRDDGGKRELINYNGARL